MPHVRISTLALSFLLLGALVACNQQSPSPSTASGASAGSAPPTSEESGMMEGSGTGDTAGDPDSSMEELEDAHIYEGGAHQDHNSKHGGTFFMALDNRHHIEGVLDRPGVFRVYIYDAFTHPVSLEELQQTEARVIWGEKDGAPELELKPSEDGSCLEATAPEPIHFPVTLTLLSRLAGTSPASRPELFTFPFSHYSHIDATPHIHPSE
jgi:hypothetical protein